ncbi:MAG: glycosyltransferase [Bryobacterales bacterium]|nr:glycosyltransferase [Bryobacterales bacterium]
MLPLISIVIPTFNSAPFLSHCLGSIAKQDYPKLEVVVVDNCSTDATGKIVDRYSRLITRFISEPDRGQADAVTKGLRIAAGDIAHWHASDDILLPNALHQVASAFSSNPNLDLVFSDGLAFDAHGVYAGAYSRFVDFWTSLLFFGRFQSDCAYWRHSITPAALPLDDEKRLTCDEDFFLRLWAGRPHMWIPRPLGAFRIRDGQLSGRLPKSEVAAHRADSRRRVCAAMGLSSAEADRLRRTYRWKYLLGSCIAPRAYSAARFAVRKLTFDWTRRRYAEWFLKEWLREVG